jgi:hypothetical protein
MAFFIKFCFDIQLPSETFQMFEEAYGKAATKKTQVYKWYKSFRDGHASVMMIHAASDRQL